MAAWTDSESCSSSINDSDSLPPVEDIDGDERQGEQLSSLPPLVLISSLVKEYKSLVKLANPGVAVIYYSHQSTTLVRILQYIRDILRGRKAYSICFVANGRPGLFKLNSQKNVTLSSITEDKELRDFFTELVSTYLHGESDLARIDILNCSIEDDAEGKQAIQTLSKLVRVPVHTSKDIWGAELSFPNSNEDGPIKIGTLYFDGQRLKEWYNADSKMTLDKYEQIRIVGQGAYGQAVLYRRKDDDSKVILKKINVLELRKEERQGVLTEIRILAMLDHPHIVSYYDSFEENGVMMIEMEFAEGGSLQQYLKVQVSPLTEFDVLTKFSQMVDAIRYIHAHNILHRDLKTANIFLTRFGSVKLGDFGIAKVLSATHEAAQTMVGTPYYISPEICKGKRYDAKSDIWSLACILYEMLCLQKTFEGTNLPALVHKIVEGSFEPIKGQYSEGLKQLVKQMLQKNPNDRPSADQLHTKLVPILLKPLQEKEGVLPPLTDIAPADDVNTRSFLYYLDGTSFLLKPVALSLQEKICSVAVGYSHIVVVTDGLSVYSWGHNSHGQLGQGDQQTRNQPTLIESLNGKSIKNVQCGGDFSIFMSENGIVMSCGRGDRGMLGHGNTRDCSKPEIIQELLSHDVSMIECGESHVVMLTLDSKILVWGSGDCGRLGTGSGDDCMKPTEITVRSPGVGMNETVRDIRCGVDCSVFITDVGRLFACGNNTDNKLGLNKRETFLMHMKKLLSKNQLEVPCCSIPTPIKELGKHRIVDCFMGVTHSVFLTESGLVYTFGRNLEAQLGAGHCHATEMPNIVKGFTPKPLTVKSTELATIVASESNSFYIWGSRPVVKSPLEVILSGDTDNDGGNGRGIPKDQIPSSPDLGFTESPKQNQCFEEVVVNDRNTPVLKSENSGSKIRKDSVEADVAQGSPKIRHQSTVEAMFAEVPHEQIPCIMVTKYISTVFENSNRLSTNTNRRVARQTSIASVKKKPHGSMDKINMSVDGKIMSPVSIDLVEESGISTSLWSQGLENIKLEDIVCYGSNLVVLLYATLLKKGGAKKRRESFVVGRKLRRSSVASSLVSVQLPPHEGKQYTHPDILEEDSEQEDEKEAFSKMVDRPMSPTTELPTWLKGDLQEGIPISNSGPSINDNKVDESHGWFPNSMKNDAVPPVDRPMVTDGQKGNKKKPLTRRPSGLEIGVTNDPNSPPVVTSPDQITGVKRLPPTTVKMRQESIAEPPGNTAVTNQPTSIRLSQAKSIANLPTKSTVHHQTVKRVHSSSNVSKTQDRGRMSDVSGKPATGHTDSPTSCRGKLKKTHTMPKKIEDTEGNHQSRKPSNADNGNEPSKKVKLPKNGGSPYLQSSEKGKSTVPKSTNKTSVSRDNGKKADSGLATKINEEKLRKEFEEEKGALIKRIEEEHLAQNNERIKLKAEIDDLNKRLEKMEEKKLEFDQIKEKLFQLEKAKVQETNSSKENGKSRFCSVM